MCGKITLRLINQIIDYNDFYPYEKQASNFLGVIQDKVHNIIVERDGVFIGSLFGIGQLKGIQDLKIIVNNKEIQIKEEMKIRLIQYLSLSDKEQEEKECTWFYKFLLGEEANNDFNEKDRDYIEYQNENEISLGDIIMISPEDIKNGRLASLLWKGKTHFSIYLGNGVYISKIGKRKKFTITNIKMLGGIYGKKEGSIFTYKKYKMEKRQSLTNYTLLY